MKRFRHPIASIREPFGKAGLTVAVIALVMALIGGAYAAGGLTKSQEKQVTKIAKKYAGKPGAAGANGSNGTNGTAGADGTPGAQGDPGAPGASLKTSAASEAECKEGGTKLEVEGAGSPRHVCNGSPWTAGGTLPKGATETGAYIAPAGVATTEIETEVEGTKETLKVAVPSSTEETTISFPIPLSETAAENTTAVYIKNSDTPPTECGGTPSEPKAKEGFLCIYEGGFSSGVITAAFIFPAGQTGQLTTGAFIGLQSEASGAKAVGTWAVTAP